MYYTILIKCWEAFANSLKLKHVVGWLYTVFCPTIQDYSDIYLYCKKALGDSFLYPTDAPDMCEYRLVEVFHSVLDESHKQKILSAFTCSDPASPLRIVVATVAFGLWVDYPNVDKVIHYRQPHDMDMYIQKTGWAGCDGRQCHALLLSRKFRYVDTDVLAYINL